MSATDVKSADQFCLISFECRERNRLDLDLNGQQSALQKHFFGVLARKLAEIWLKRQRDDFEY